MPLNTIVSVTYNQAQLLDWLYRNLHHSKTSLSAYFRETAQLVDYRKHTAGINRFMILENSCNLVNNKHNQKNPIDRKP